MTTASHDLNSTSNFASLQRQKTKGTNISIKLASSTSCCTSSCLFCSCCCSFGCSSSKPLPVAPASPTPPSPASPPTASLSAPLPSPPPSNPLFPPLPRPSPATRSCFYSSSPFSCISFFLLLLLLPMHQSFSGVVSQFLQPQLAPPSCGGRPKRLITSSCSCSSLTVSHLVGVASHDDVIQVWTTLSTPQPLDLLRVLGPAVGSPHADVSQWGRLASKRITDNLNC